MDKTDIFLAHYGVAKRSGRYPYGSGERPFQSEPWRRNKERSKQVFGSAETTVKRTAKVREAERAVDFQNEMNTDLRKLIDRNQTKNTKSQLPKVLLMDTVALNPVGLIYDSTKEIVAAQKERSYFSKREKQSAKDPDTGLYLKRDGEYDGKQDLAAVNPGFLNYNANTKNNCMLCTVTYEMRQRGYDVTAQKDSFGYNFKDLQRWFPKVKINRSERLAEDGSAIRSDVYAKDTINQMLKLGDGARGNLMMCFTKQVYSTGGHSVFFQVDDGKVILFDGQSNKRYDNAEEIIARSSACSFARLDDLAPNMKTIIKEVVR